MDLKEKIAETDDGADELPLLQHHTLLLTTVFLQRSEPVSHSIDIKYDYV